MNYIFLDEPQQIPAFERLIDALFVETNIDLYVTGSNAYFLSGEIATLLTGRYITIHILPFSFLNLLKVKKIQHLANMSSLIITFMKLPCLKVFYCAIKEQIFKIDTFRMFTTPLWKKTYGNAITFRI